MALRLTEIYDARLDAGASEEKARKAAEAVAAYDHRLAAPWRKLAVHTYRLATMIMIGLGILWRVLKEERADARTDQDRACSPR